MTALDQQPPTPAEGLSPDPGMTQPEPGQQPQRPAPPDLEADPFGQFLGAEETQVAGLGQSLLKLFLGGGDAAGRKAAGEGAESAAGRNGAAGAPPGGAPPGGGASQAGAAPGGSQGAQVGGPLTKSTPPLEGRLTPPQPVLGTTRPLANPSYFDSPDTQEVLEKLHRYGRTPDPVSWDTTKAKALAVDVEKVTGRKPGLGWAPEDVLKLRQIADAQARDLKGMADKLQTRVQSGSTPSTEELAEFELASARLVGTQNAIAGLSTEAARLLNSLQIRVDTPDAAARQLADLVRSRGGEETVAARVAAVASAPSPSAVHRAARGSWGERAVAGLLKLRYNMMLSSARTHAANVAGSTISSAYEGASDIAAVVTNRLMLRPATRVLAAAGFPARVQEALPWASLQAEASGGLRGLREGLKLAWDIARGAPDIRDPTGGTGKFMSEMGMRVRAGEDAMLSGSGSPVVRGVGQVASTPTRMLEAEDAFFRSVAYRQRLHTLAMDRAHAEAGGDLARRDALYAQYLGAPPETMAQAAREHSARLTFTADTSIYGSLLHAAARVGRTINRHPVGNLILPFVQTPANLTGYVLDKASGGFLTPGKTVRALLGAEGVTAREQADAWVRVEMAVGLAYLLYPEWEDGRFTGVGSTNWSTRQVMESQGWKPNALRVGDTYYGLERLDPMGQLLAMYASAFEIAKEEEVVGGDNAALAMMAAVLSTGDVLAERSFLSSVTEFLVALDRGADGTKALMDLTASTAASFVIPGLMRDMRMAADPTSRSLQVDYSNGLGAGLWDRFANVVANATPGASANLPPRIDWKGDVITNGGGAFWRALVPVSVGELKPDDASAWLLVNGIAPRKPSHEITLPGTSGRVAVNLLELDPRGALYAGYQQIVGRERYKAVQAIVSSPPFRKAMEAGDVGPESAAGMKIAQAVGRAKRETDQRFLQWMMEGGGVLDVGPKSYRFDESTFPAMDEVKAAVRRYMTERAPTELPGVEFRHRANAWIPDQLAPSTEAGEPRF